MANRRGRDTGPSFYGPVRTRLRPDGQTREFTDEVYGWNPRLVPDMWWEFAGGASGYLQGTNGLLVSRSTGTPTGISQVANTANGELAMALAVTNEAEYSGVDFADELNIPASRAVFFEAFIKTPALALTSVQDIVIGLATAYNATLNSQSKYVRFRLSGSNAVLLEGKDGTTTNNATAPLTATTLAAATYYLFTIDGHTNGEYDFYIDDNLIGTLVQSAFAATDLLQPAIGVAKASGTGIPILTMDLLRIDWSRL